MILRNFSAWRLPDAMSNFGASFRRAREAAGLPLEKIAAETRISTRFLLAIESEDFHLLPGGVFNRGFVRAYAAHLGLDADQAVTEYSRISATSDDPVDQGRDGERKSAKPQRNLYPILVAILLALIAVYYIVNRGSASNPGEVVTPPVVQEAATQPAGPVATNVTVEPDQVAAAQSSSPSVTTSPPPALPLVASEARATASVTPFATAALVLELDVKELTWIRVATDGTVALNDSMSAGTVRRFSAERTIDVILGNAGGANLKINGRDMGLLGARGQVREFKITTENALSIQG
jgi:cytoskeletal protein RodZ